MVWNCMSPKSYFSEKETAAIKQSVAVFPTSPVNKTDPILHCVYDKNCSKLYTAIEETKWGEVARFLDTGKWTLTLMPDFPPTKQVLTMVTCFDEKASILWSRLPLHLAILNNAPLGIIGRLLDMAPIALSIPDHDGNLALHLALLSNSDDKSIEYILKCQPRAIFEVNKSGLLPIQCAFNTQENTSRGTILKHFLIYSRSRIHDSLTQKVDLYCDHKRNCSPLYREVEEENWNVVMHFLTTGKWPDKFWLVNFFGLGEAVSPVTAAEQAMTVVKNTTDEGKVKWARLPLHSAILSSAPFVVIKGLVDLEPKSVRVPDSYGMLPLHLALCIGLDDEAVAYLLSHFPEAANARGMRGLTPIEIALKGMYPLRGEILQGFTAQQESKENSEPSMESPKQVLPESNVASAE